MLFDEVHDGLFQRGCGQTPTGEVLVATVLDEAPGDVVPEPLPALLFRMARRQPVPGLIEELAGERGGSCKALGRAFPRFGSPISKESSFGTGRDGGGFLPTARYEPSSAHGRSGPEITSRGAGDGRAPRQNEALDLLVAKRGDWSDTGRPACREVARQHRGSTIRIVGGGRRCQTVDFAKSYPSVALFGACAVCCW